MLSRRHLRIKVLHALYGYFQNSSADLTRGLRQMEKSIDEIRKLYLFELKILTDIHRIATDEIEWRKNKKLPTGDDLNPSTRFVENKFLNWLRDSREFLAQTEEKKTSWREHRELLKRIFRQFAESEEYHSYLRLPQNDLEEDKRIVKLLYGRYIVNNETLHQIYEDWNIHWADDLDAAQMMVAKTIKRFDASYKEATALPRLIKDQADLEFARSLYTKVIKNSESYESMIRDKAQHWEVDRIAILDVILMKQALAELVSFKEIPVKVTLNEYIELSKEYSTPKSGNFINGILDKLKAELEETGEIRKIGRGLL